MEIKLAEEPALNIPFFFVLDSNEMSNKFNVMSWNRPQILQVTVITTRPPTYNTVREFASVKGR